MTKDITLLEKREELKHKLNTSKYRTLGKLLTDRTEKLIQRLTRNPEPLPSWFSLLVITLSIVIIGLLISILLGEFPPHSEAILMGISGLGLIYVMLLTLEIYVGFCFSFAQNHLLDAMGSIKDLVDFQHWLDTAFSIRKQFFFGVALTVFALFYSFFSTPNILFESVFFGFGPTISGLIFGVLTGSYFYFFFPGLSLVVRFSSRYQFKVYAVDPSSSEFIDHLSGILSYGVYIAAGFVAIFTFHNSLYYPLTLHSILFFILLGWIPVTGFFVANHYVLSKIITRAKWKILSEIQMKIETVQAQEEIPTKDTVAHIRALIDYHDYIRSTRNSVLGLRAGLNFLNSLLLPLFTIILGNLDKILDLFR